MIPSALPAPTPSQPTTGSAPRAATNGSPAEFGPALDRANRSLDEVADPAPTAGDRATETETETEREIESEHAIGSETQDEPAALSTPSASPAAPMLNALILLGASQGPSTTRIPDAQPATHPKTQTPRTHPRPTPVAPEGVDPNLGKDTTTITDADFSAEDVGTENRNSVSRFAKALDGNEVSAPTNRAETPPPASDSRDDGEVEPSTPGADESERPVSTSADEPAPSTARPREEVTLTTDQPPTATTPTSFTIDPSSSGHLPVEPNQGSQSIPGRTPPATPIDSADAPGTSDTPGSPDILGSPDTADIPGTSDSVAPTSHQVDTTDRLASGDQQAHGRGVIEHAVATPSPGVRNEVATGRTDARSAEFPRLPDEVAEQMWGQVERALHRVRTTADGHDLRLRLRPADSGI